MIETRRLKNVIFIQTIFVLSRKILDFPLIITVSYAKKSKLMKVSHAKNTLNYVCASLKKKWNLGAGISKIIKVSAVVSKTIF